MAADTYIVKKNDTLSEIAEDHLADSAFSKIYEYVAALVKINNLKDADLIYVGQELKLDGEATDPAKTSAGQARIDAFGLQSNTDRTIFAVWTWSKDHTDHYETEWYYSTGDTANGKTVWFTGNKGTTEDTVSTYSAPENALLVKFKVKPISESKSANGNGSTYWTASWSTEKTYDFEDNPPAVPSVPTVKIDQYKLTATVTGIDLTTTGKITFEVVRSGGIAVYKTDTCNVLIDTATCSWEVEPGYEYRVRARGVKQHRKSNWSAYSSAVGTVPAASKGITEVRALSETSVYVKWETVANADKYTVEYATKQSYFDSSTEVKSMTVEADHAEVTGLDSGEEYFFRVRATNDLGDSPWTEVKSVIVGSKPGIPTTWSSTTTAITGESLSLYWVHNSEDGSKQTYAELELTIDGEIIVRTIENENTDEDDEEEPNSVYKIDTLVYSEGTQILWRVRTAGITKQYGEWSTQRTVDIYAPPVLAVTVINGKGESLDTLESFPFYISGLAGPNTQAPIGYHVSVIANDSYETVDTMGNVKMVNAGDEVFSKYYDITTALMLQMSANNLDLENNITYTVRVTVSMNSGLTAESSAEFLVAWTDDIYEPNAEVSINTDNFTAAIMPYCTDPDGNYIENVTLSVYRREFDGTFTELITGLENTGSTYITDPHPALDYARYRIVAIAKDTGAVGFYDMPGVPVGGTAAIIQWDEAWSSFNSMNEDALEEPTYAGSMIKLPYNLDTSDNVTPDVALVQYIGRSHPVSYYGTQVGTKASWKVDVDATDTETIYALRRLQIWMGDAYVREPSGTGYWAHVEVSMSKTHCETVIPVSLTITRVTGGV